MQVPKSSHILANQDYQLLITGSAAAICTNSFDEPDQAAACSTVPIHFSAMAGAEATGQTRPCRRSPPRLPAHRPLNVFRSRTGQGCAMNKEECAVTRWFTTAVASYNLKAVIAIRCLGSSSVFRRESAYTYRSPAGFWRIPIV